MRTFGKILAVSIIGAGAAYAGSDADPYDSLDSVGQMFLEASQEIPVALSAVEKQEVCRDIHLASSAKMASLKEFLALSDEQLSELTLKRTPDQDHSYHIALASFEIELRRDSGKRAAVREAVGLYREAVHASQPSASYDISVKVLADIEAALSAAEAALKGL